MRQILRVGGAVVALAFATPAFAGKSTEVASNPGSHCQAPRWSPDGNKLAYELYNPKRDTREMWIIEVRNSTGSITKGQREGVTAGSLGAASKLGGKAPPVIDFSWAPDMKSFARPYIFSARSPKKNFDLYFDESWLTDNPGNDGQPTFSDDVKYIAYTSQQKQSGDIMLIDIDELEPIRLTEWPTATEFRPRWAPGKPTLLFTRSMSGSKGQDIGVIDDVTNAKATTRFITEWDADEIRPAWSPDANKIAFYSNKGNANNKQFDLYVIGADGKNLKKLESDVAVDDSFGAVWTPDGSTVLFVKQDFDKDNPVMWARVDGSAKGELETGTQLNGELAIKTVSGRLFLAFRALGEKGSDEKTWQRVYVMPFDMDDLK